VTSQVRSQSISQTLYGEAEKERREAEGGKGEGEITTSCSRIDMKASKEEDDKTKPDVRGELPGRSKKKAHLSHDKNLESKDHQNAAYTNNWEN